MRQTDEKLQHQEGEGDGAEGGTWMVARWSAPVSAMLSVRGSRVRPLRCTTQPISPSVVGCVFRHVLYLVFTFQTYKICPMSSQFELENAIREATRMDTSLSKAAWKPRKALENTNTSLNISSGKCIRAQVPKMHSSVFK